MSKAKPKAEGASPASKPRKSALKAKSPLDAIRQGLVMVPDDRKALGVVLPHSIWENLAYSNFDEVEPPIWKSLRFLGGSCYPATALKTP